MANLSANGSDSSGSAGTVTLKDSLSEQRARVDQLTGEVSQMGEAVKKMMEFLQNSPILNPPQPAPAPVHHQADQSREAPPHLQRHADPPFQPPHQPQDAPDPGYHPSVGVKFAHLSRLEPLKLQDLWFFGFLSADGQKFSLATILPVSE